MKRYLYLLTSLFLLVSQLGTSQIYQKTDQRGISNYYTDALLLPDSIVILSEGIQESGQLHAALRAETPFEEVLWEVIPEDTNEVFLFNELISIDENTFGVLGFRQFCCDCTPPVAFYQIRSIENGELLEEVNEVIPMNFGNNAFINREFSVAMTDWGFTVPNYNGNEQTVFNFTDQGDLISTYTLPPGSASASGFEGDFITRSGSKIYRFDELGNALDSVAVSSDIYALASSENALAALDNETLTLFDSNLDVTESISITQGNYLISGTSSGFTLVNAEKFYRISESGEIEIEYGYTAILNFEVEDITAQDDLYILAGAKRSDAFSLDQISHRHAAWQMHDNGGAAELWHTDLTLVDISIDELELNESDFYITYNASVSVTVANTGSFPVSSFYLNHAQAAGICHPFFQNEFYEETILHLGETTVSMPSISGFTLPSTADSIWLNICVFVTNPMDQMDWDVSDDSICISDYYFLSTNDINLGSFVKVYPNPARDVLRIDSELAYSEISMINTLGQIVETKIFNGQGYLDISHLIPGFYLLKIETERGQVTKKIVID